MNCSNPAASGSSQMSVVHKSWDASPMLASGANMDSDGFRTDAEDRLSQSLTRVPSRISYSRQSNAAIAAPPDRSSALPFTIPSPASRSHGLPSSSSQQSSQPYLDREFMNSRHSAARYNISANLPPPPRASPLPPQSPSPMAAFESLRANYLAMRAQEASDSAMDTVAPADLTSVAAHDLESPPPASAEDGARAMHKINELIASPEFLSLGNDFDSPAAEPTFPSFDADTSALLTIDDEYLTSPMEPLYDAFDTSPLEDTPYTEFLPTPRLESTDEPAGHTYDNMPLFGGVNPDAWKAPPPPPALYTIPSSESSHRAPPPARRRASTPRRATATGTRRNVSLIPLEAPIQKRRYITPSATSRKDGEEVDVDVIEERRRKNTLAARVSRQRKLETLRAREEEVRVLKRERDMWRERARMLGGMLGQAGVLFEGFDDAE